MGAKHSGSQVVTESRVTSRDVAAQAGVSRTTVSLVLNDVPGANISQATRHRVLQVARELGYVPDAAARSLAESGRVFCCLVVAIALLAWLLFFSGF